MEDFTVVTSFAKRFEAGYSKLVYRLVTVARDFFFQPRPCVYFNVMAAINRTRFHGSSIEVPRFVELEEFRGYRGCSLWDSPRSS